jgi:Anti-sigma factor NepR
VSTVPNRQGWDLVAEDDKNTRDGNRMARTRQRAIGRELRRIYDNVTREPVPNEFLDLLRKIDDSKGGSEEP